MTSPSIRALSVGHHTAYSARREADFVMPSSIPERLVSANFPGEFPAALRTFGSADSSLRDADTADQILVARIRPYGVENWFNFEIDHEIIAFVETFF